MTQAIVAFTLKKLDEFLTKEVNFLLGIKDDVEWLRDELIMMLSFLEDAEQKQDIDKKISSWIAEIRLIASKIEDIIEAFSTEVKGKEPSKTKLLSTSLQKCLCCAGETNVYNIGKEIEALKKRVREISRQRVDYGINNIGNTQETAYAASNDRLRDLRRTTSFAHEEHFVGLDDDFKLLETQLSSSESRRGVLSILGMGGLGKTSLARKLYKTNKSRFKLHAWVCVSQQWNTRDLLERIIKSLRKLTYQELHMLEKMNDDDMKRYLNDLLTKRRYLLVIDDMWDKEAWECLRSALPDNQNRSRVIITTRKKYVAELGDKRTYVLNLRHLRANESWELFCMKAFSNRNGSCPQDLEKIGKEMVEKCEGLPLAIIVLGGLLSCKKSNEWHVIKKHIWNALIDESLHISALLDLSYNDLSRELKSCFLYWGIFPEDYEIRSEKLIQLWIAEDLIPQSKRLDLEELAESYIMELNARSLIQFIRLDDISTASCRVHDLLRDLTVNKGEKQDFFRICEESKNTTIKPFSTRRIAFRSGFESYVAAIVDHSYPQIHTLSFLNYHSLLNDGDVAKLLTLINTKFKSLRVLDLEGVKIINAESKSKLFEAIGKLVHLRYLGLFDTGKDELPESIGNLRALQTVDMVKGNSGLLLLSDINKLKQFRYLKGNFRTTKGDSSVPLEDLTNLQCLDRIDISGWLKNEESDEFALNVFSKLCNIRTLNVWFLDTKYRLSIEPLFSCKNLIELELRGKIKSLPMELHESLPNLRYLTLYHADFEQDPFPTLEKLPNLLVLVLAGFMVKSLIITATGFHKLVALEMWDIPTGMKWKIEEGALPSVTRIFAGSDLTNFTIPEGLRVRFC